jgi:hypothetical protein
VGDNYYEKLGTASAGDCPEGQYCSLWGYCGDSPAHQFQCQGYDTANTMAASAYVDQLGPYGGGMRWHTPTKAPEQCDYTCGDPRSPGVVPYPLQPINMTAGQDICEVLDCAEASSRLSYVGCQGAACDYFNISAFSEVTEELPVVTWEHCYRICEVRCLQLRAGMRLGERRARAISQSAPRPGPMV